MTDAAPVPIENEEQREFQELVDSSFKIRFIGQRLVPTNMFTKEMTSESCQPLQPRQQEVDSQKKEAVNEEAISREEQRLAIEK